MTLDELAVAIQNLSPERRKRPAVIVFGTTGEAAEIDGIESIEEYDNKALPDQMYLTYDNHNDPNLF